MAHAGLTELVAAALVLAAASPAWSEDRVREEPTTGLALPTTPLAGEHDARAVVANPGGLALVRGTELAAALDLDDPDVARGAGQGFGLYGARTFGGGWLPRFALGAGAEWLRPIDDALGPADAFRLSLGLAVPVGRNLGVGAAWHRYVADGALARTSALDLGASLRLDNHLAVGAVLRDLATRVGGDAVQRRYELELVGRPLGSDAVELALGGRLGEDRHDVDGWGRASLRVVRGVALHGQVESRALALVRDDGTAHDARELRATLGVELSLGNIGAAAFGTLRSGADRATKLRGGSYLVRASSLGPASVFGSADHIERVELTGELSVRALTQAVLRLRAIGRDPTAKAVVVTFDGVSGGWATLDELRGELVRLRAAGKHVFAYMVTGTGRDYYVASAAQRIYLDPAGGLRLVGMAGTTTYFRGVFDALGVVPQFEKIAEYKSAPEQFTELGPTPDAARMRNEMLDSLWERWVATVAEARQLTPAQLRALVDAGPYTAGQLADASAAPAAKLVDNTALPSGSAASLGVAKLVDNTALPSGSAASLGVAKLVDAVAGPEKISELILRDIGRALPIDQPSPTRPARWAYPGIAIIYVDGDITDGTSRAIPLLGRAVAGGESLIQAVVAARNDPRVGAIVLRIDSPGGSALASELIAREVFATRGVKPILCSMSDVAASGGYFVAAGCDRIFAEPMTITGSIGIFTGKFDVGGLARKLGITVDTAKRGERADIESMFRPYSDAERAVVKEGLRYSYGRFVGAVAEGRGLARDAVDAVGRGHVWTGAQAMPIRLIDQLGGLGDAIDEAKRRMGLAQSDQVSVFELPQLPASLLDAVGRWLGVDSSAAPAASALELGDVPAVRALLRGVPASLLLAPATPQARLPFELEWQ